ncbi:MAG: MFS transporter [Candidatus Humimicrobiaceae bacterium]
MGDIIPPRLRGKYFGIRNRATGAVSLAAVLMGGFLLKAFQQKQLDLVGFGVLFTLAFFFKYISYTIFKKHYSPRYKTRKADAFSFKTFLKRKDNFTKFSIYQGFFYFAIMFASPFFAVYMLEELKFNYLTFTLVATSASAFYLVFTPIIGKFSDKFGNVKLFYLANALFVLTPIAWFFTKSPIVLIFVPQLLAGLANAALLLATTNFTYDNVTPRQRGTSIAYNNMLIGIGTFIGSLAGGAFIQYIPIPFSNAFFTIFGIAVVLRLLVGLIFLPQLKEQHENIQPLPPLHIDITHPFKTLHAEISWLKSVSH